MFGILPASAAGTGGITADALRFAQSQPGILDQGPLDPLGGIDVGTVNVPQFAIGQNGFGGNGLDFWGKADIALGGLQTLGGLFLGLKQLSQAKKQFNFTKDVTETNLANSIKQYNTALADQRRSRAFTEGRSQASADAEVAKYRLSRSGNG